MKRSISAFMILLTTISTASADVKGIKVNDQTIDIGQSFRVAIDNVEADVTLTSADEKSFNISYPALFVTAPSEACTSSAGQKRTSITEGGMLIENVCDKSALSMVVFKDFHLDPDGYLSVEMHQPKL
jgi:hypothetical protein